MKHRCAYEAMGRVPKIGEFVVPDEGGNPLSRLLQRRPWIGRSVRRDADENPRRLPELGEVLHQLGPDGSVLYGDGK